MIRRRVSGLTLRTSAAALTIFLMAHGSEISISDLVGPAQLITIGLVAGFMLAVACMQATVRQADAGGRFAQRTLDLMFGQPAQPRRQATSHSQNSNQKGRRQPTTKQVIRRVKKAA